MIDFNGFSIIIIIIETTSEHFQKWLKNQGVVLALSPPIDNRWELKITATFSFDCSSFININRLIVIDCHRLFRSCRVTADFQVVSSCTGTQKKETLTNCVITPCMVMKTIGIPSCTGTPGQPLFISMRKNERF